jgi:hypothetical protein
MFSNLNIANYLLDTPVGLYGLIVRRTILYFISFLMKKGKFIFVLTAVPTSRKKPIDQTNKEK